MLKISYAALALVAGLTVSGVASADEYISNANREDYAVAEQSATEATRTVVAPLNYAQPQTARQAEVNAIFAAPRSADSLQLQLGDRGIGSN